MPVINLQKTCQAPSEIKFSSIAKTKMIRKINNLRDYLRFYFLRAGQHLEIDLAQFPSQIRLALTSIPEPILTSELNTKFIADHNQLAQANGFALTSDIGFTVSRSEGALQTRFNDIVKLFDVLLAQDFNGFDSARSENIESLINNLFQRFFAQILDLQKGNQIFAAPGFFASGTGWGEGFANLFKSTATTVGYNPGNNLLAELFNLFINDYSKNPQDKQYYNALIHRILTHRYTEEDIIPSPITTLSSNGSDGVNGSPAGFITSISAIITRARGVESGSPLSTVTITMDSNNSLISPIVKSKFKLVTEKFLNQPAYLKYSALFIASGVGLAAVFYKLSGKSFTIDNPLPLTVPVVPQVLDTDTIQKVAKSVAPRVVQHSPHIRAITEGVMAKTRAVVNTPK